MALVTFASGDTISSSDVNANFTGLANGSLMHYNAAWSTYSPTWSCSGTAPSLGNGTLNGRYLTIGKTIFFRIFLKGGSTTTWGTSQMFFTLPTNNSLSDYPTNHHVVGSVYMEDTSATTGYMGYARILSTQQNKVSPSIGLASGTYTQDQIITNAIPVTLAVGDWISISGCYESV